MANKARNCDLSWLGQVKASNRQRNEQLYQRILAGDKEAAEEMVRTNVPLAVSIVAARIRRNWSLEPLREDMLSAAHVGLTKAAAKMAADGPVDKPNPTGLMIVCIHRELSDFLHNNTTIREPSRTQRRAMRQEQPIYPPNVERQRAEPLVDPDEVRDLKEAIYACCETCMEEDIVCLREEGYTYEEIASILQLSSVTVFRSVKAIEARLLEELGWAR